VHRHKNCRDGRIPKSRKNYWKPKLLANVDRDKKNIKKLKKKWLEGNGGLGVCN
ncbi:uncharacterized protein METZ01_LOCUS427447, partial [marine metagenome]